MSLCALGMAEELRGQGIAVNALWPRTLIWTAALAMLGAVVKPEQCRKPEILAHAAHAVLTRPPACTPGTSTSTTRFWPREGVTDLDRYAVAPGMPLFPDFFVEQAWGPAALRLERSEGRGPFAISSSRDRRAVL